VTPSFLFAEEARPEKPQLATIKGKKFCPKIWEILPKAVTLKKRGKKKTGQQQQQKSAVSCALAESAKIKQMENILIY
jgi:hypothetical protein